MRRWIPLLTILFAAACVAACTSPQQPVQPTAAATIPTPPVTPAQQGTTPAPTPISQASVSDNTVTIKNFAFTPQTITVTKGEVVRWENMDAAPHRIMFTDSGGRDTNIESSVLSSSQSYSRKFDTSGTYPYYCKIHPEMKGTVIVG